MLQVSQTYELQALHQAAQAAAVEALVTQRAATGASGDPTHSRILLARLRALRGFDQSLDDDYAELLPGGGGA